MLSKHPREQSSLVCFDNISRGFLSDSHMGPGRINPLNIIDLQTQIDMVSLYASKRRYEIHPRKSKCITYNIQHPGSPQLNGTLIEVAYEATHLGIVRVTNSASPDLLSTKNSLLAYGE